MARPRKDIVSFILEHAEEIITVLNDYETGNDIDANSILKSIKTKAEMITENCKVMQKYRELKLKPIYLFNPQKNEFYEATKSEKIKIARRMLMDAGII